VDRAEIEALAATELRAFVGRAWTRGDWEACRDAICVLASRCCDAAVQDLTPVCDPVLSITRIEPIPEDSSPFECLLHDLAGLPTRLAHNIQQQYPDVDVASLIQELEALIPTEPSDLLALPMLEPSPPGEKKLGRHLRRVGTTRETD
jgi:hypothetical protein